MLTPLPGTLCEGIVFRVNSGNYHVQTADRGIVIGKLRGTLKKDLVYSTSGSRPRRVDMAHKRRSTDPIAVGDRVRIDPVLQIIEEILPRHSELARESPSQRGQHVLVANLDQVFVVFAAADPRPDLWLLDRFLVMAGSAGIEARIVINKMDLPEVDAAATAQLLAVYEQIGYQVLFLSVRAQEGLETLRSLLAGRISAFTGPSGVGKSSLLNALHPGLRLRTGDMGEITHKGQHTTTSAELIPLDGVDSGWVADTPGLRQVDFWEVEKDDIPLNFPEFAPYLNQCRFADCRHRGELGCAVGKALEAGRIDARRYRSFIQMTD